MSRLREELGCVAWYALLLIVVVVVALLWPRP